MEALIRFLQNNPLIIGVFIITLLGTLIGIFLGRKKFYDNFLSKSIPLPVYVLIILFVVVVLAIIFRPATKDHLLVLAGGFCAAFGGFISTWYKVRNARKIKMEETIGRRKVDVYMKALRLARYLESILIQGVFEDVLSFISEENPWVIDNEILLPPKFAKYWHSVRHNILSAQRKDESRMRMSGSTKQNEIRKIANEIETLETLTDKLAEDAVEEIRNELGLPTFEIIRPPKQKGSDK